ncbi:MAG: transporter substrate-binding domain-containing protein [Actinomycetota bacterium]|nr:transporter substrate-binding domain-containing protein [Actinomycetota bacterium]
MPYRLTAAALAGCLAVSGCVSPEPAAAPKNIYIGLQTDQPGLGYFDGQRRSGFEYDMANWLANHLKVRPTFVDVKPDRREQIIKDRDVQLMIGTYSKTDERAQHVAFVAPYLFTRQGAMVRATDTSITSFDDLLIRGTVCAARGTTSVKQLRERAVNLVETIGDGECAHALFKPDGDVRAASTDQLILRGWAQHDSRLKVVEGVTFGHVERYGIGLEKGNKDLCEKVTSALKEYLLSGTWETHFRNNLGMISPSEHKPDPHSLDRCE